MRNKENPVFVTQSSLPPLNEYVECLTDIFQSKWLTNQGNYARLLEKELAAFLNVPAVFLCANGTLALQLSLRLLGMNGKKIITTPFTYVATTSAIIWEGGEPLYADIDPESLCIDPAHVERLLQEHQDIGGILPVHVYGNACDVYALHDISLKYGVPVLYDAAHSFGSVLDGKSLFAFGDAAIGSFHATKLFHTVEGGCIVAKQEYMEKVALLRAFGHCDDEHICVGMNAKISEPHAAMGICMLPRMPEIMAKRTRLSTLYDELLDINGKSGIRRPALAKDLKWNHAYYPVIFPDHESMTAVLQALKKENIHPRRYFYPSLSTLPYVKRQPCPISEDMAERVLCLPFWPDMDEELLREIADIIRMAISA